MTAQPPPPGSPPTEPPNATDAPPWAAAQPEAPPESTAATSVTSSIPQLNVERATELTEELVDRGAPWSANAAWRIVAGEAVVAGILGLLFLFRPIGGASTTLQLMGLVLLVGALLTSFQIWKHKVAPELEVLAAFRAGSGVTVGLVIVMATFFTTVTPEVSASLAVVLGIGFLVFGVSGVVSSFIGRPADMPLPLPGLVATSVLAVAGAVLMFAGAGGAGAVDGILNLLGILVVAAAVILGGWAYLLYQHEAEGLRR